MPAYCPHCQLLVEEDRGESWPARPQRCPHCRLLIGAGRALAAPAGGPGARGTAAGVFARDAKRTDDDRPEATDAEVRGAIREVAAHLGTQPERLLMVDYQQQVVSQNGLPSLQAVFAAYGSWKHARREAAKTA